MNRLLAEALTAHGGLERWRAVTAITAHGTFRGLLRSRFPGNRLANVNVRVQLAEQHAVLNGFPQEDERPGGRNCRRGTTFTVVVDGQGHQKPGRR